MTGVNQVRHTLVGVRNSTLATSSRPVSGGNIDLGDALARWLHASPTALAQEKVFDDWTPNPYYLNIATGPVQSIHDINLTIIRTLDTAGALILYINLVCRMKTNEWHNVDPNMKWYLYLQSTRGDLLRPEFDLGRFPSECHMDQVPGGTPATVSQAFREDIFDLIERAEINFAGGVYAMCRPR